MKPQSAPGNVMILASAGSGKTYALTERYVKLLAAGAAPERIVALTFTRKAAGEFFDEILGKLAAAASDPEKARALAGGIGFPQMGTMDFLRLLRAVIAAMSRLSLGTLDAFFARIVRNFPLELGLSGEFALLSEPAAALERRRVQRRLFASAGASEAARREFIAAFQRATFGQEEKSLARQIDAFLEEYAETYLDAPSSEVWGDAAALWPKGCPWLSAKTTTGLADAVGKLGPALERVPLDPGPLGRLRGFAGALKDWAPGAPLPKAMDYLLPRLLSCLGDLRAGRAEITLERRKTPIPADLGQILADAAAGIMGAELARRLEMTRGIFEVLRVYDGAYRDQARRMGRLTFGDIRRLLLPGAGAPLLAGGGEGGEGRLLIDWRLDAQFDHWLLDEFQDTSFSQWSVLRNLIDEAVQDASGRRSLFYVGDVKQAIYGWREGDPRLFREIFDHYNRAAPGTIAEERLDRSWRSAPPVIAMVNRVFGSSATLADLLPPEAARRWTKEWRDHVSARPKLGGRAELRHAGDKEGRFEETIRLLREIDPVRHGLETAVLVRTNDAVAQFADRLRAAGVPAAAEGRRHIARDHPLPCALLALLRAAAHPGDAFAREHLRMTPLEPLLDQAGAASADALTLRLLGEIHADGFAAALERWCRALEPRLAPDDAFSRRRGQQLIEAARQFDETGSRDVSEFLAFARDHAVGEADAVGVVRVMTIHKSKGLGFDLVVVPDLEGQSLDREDREGLAVSRAPDRSVQWILQRPTKEFREHDPALSAYDEETKADNAYEALCQLYVALTRAKRGLCVLIEPPAKSESRNFPKILESTLGGPWGEGDASWYRDLVPARIAEEAAPEPPLPASAPRLARLPALVPSRARPVLLPAAALFSPAAAAAAAHGAAVHALLADVVWSGGPPPRWANDSGPAAVAAQACLSAPDLAEVWARPAGAAGAEVWRERSFEIVLDGSWVTGIFDRVVVARDAAGRAVAATVYDFKTDRAASPAELGAAAARHSAQLGLYRRAAACLAGLKPEQVAAEIVFTAALKRARV